MKADDILRSISIQMHELMRLHIKFDTVFMPEEAIAILIRHNTVITKADGELQVFGLKIKLVYGMHGFSVGKEIDWTIWGDDF